jgi:hypothetical protein
MNHNKEAFIVTEVLKEENWWMNHGIDRDFSPGHRPSPWVTLIGRFPNNEPFRVEGYAHQFQTVNRHGHTYCIEYPTPYFTIHFPNAWHSDRCMDYMDRRAVQFGRYFDRQCDGWGCYGEYPASYAYALRIPI